MEQEPPSRSPEMEPSVLLALAIKRAQKFMAEMEQPMTPEERKRKSGEFFGKK
ncbi:MAG: hypothetical protein JKP92_09190 [Alphaproteobacteria bacterium]|jgi:hypothetical protein|nr:hypothetical protein [Alphaproteobacteria bacterium]